MDAFHKLSLNDQQVKEIQKKPKLEAIVGQVAASVPGDEPVDKSKGSLLLALATAASKDATLPTEYVARAIADGRIATPTQLDAAIEYVKTHPTVDDAAFDQACGVGVVTTDEDVTSVVARYVDSGIATLQEQRYKYLPTLLKQVRADEALRWANLGNLKKIVDDALLAVLGPQDERDRRPAKAKAKPKDAGAAATGIAGQSPAQSMSESMAQLYSTGFLGALHKVGGNPQIKDELREEHLRATGGKVHTRFPPEPNGFLHIGHAKAITVNFGYARHHGGVCYLRFDDTNPEKEEEKFFTSILETVCWLGFEPYAITHSSDHFGRLYELAEGLVQRGKAYTCTCTDEQIKRNRGGEERGPRIACEHRSQPIEQSLSEFRAMRDGRYKPKSIVLRMKQDLEDGNPQMWDLIAYRVLDAAHHLTGDTWKIYPTYDFTHCLCDSFENITHSLCTTEFRQSRVSYEWLCDALEIYKPAQREYGRLGLQGTVMSKRKIEKLVKDGRVRDWNDPRLYTLVALRRRGIPPGAILKFVSDLGVTTATTLTQIGKFESIVRDYLEFSVPRLMMLLDPVEVELTNVADDFSELCTVPFSPRDKAMGEHGLTLTKRFYIERGDFREDDSPDFFRLAPGKTVGLLRAAHTVRALNYDTDAATGRVTKVYARYEDDVPFVKPQAYIQWLGRDCVPISEVRCHGQLFKSDDPNTAPGGFLEDIDPSSETVYHHARIETGLHDISRSAPWPRPASDAEGRDDASAPESVRFQAIRVGYFCLDTDSTQDKIVLNRIVTLREDRDK